MPDRIPVLRRRPVATLAVPAAVLAVVLSGCGAQTGDSASSTSARTPSASTPSSSPSTSTERSAASEPSPSTQVSAPASSSASSLSTPDPDSSGLTSGTAARPSKRQVGCASHPSSCGYPDASNTGTRLHKLVQVPQQRTRGRGWRYEGGTINVFRAGAVVSGLRTSAPIEVHAPRVTVRDNLLEPQGEVWGVSLRGGRNVRILHNTIRGGTGDQRGLVGIVGLSRNYGGLQVVANDISRTSTGIQVDMGTVRGNYVHDLGHKAGDHLNGFTSNQGGGGLRIIGNTFLNQFRQTDALSLFQDFGRQADVLIEGNLLGGGAWTLYAGANRMDQYGRPTGIVIRDNRFAQLYFPRSGLYGPASAYVSGGGNTFSGNYWDKRPRATVKVVR